MENTQTQQASQGAFLKSLIRINHPDWTKEQIEVEFKRQMETKDNENDDGHCEACSG